ncbi:DUF2142 domain-containing protein [Xylanimonas protaetiae]|uniref:DUF2142 domain-containing protein n=1 Tax=Xylanimonas protaetiae TaxID=2509457 RepID=UPI0013EABAE6|nr:DUF2142 domain-containing protein [Xylanimonas protaetiae]
MTAPHTGLRQDIRSPRRPSSKTLVWALLLVVGALLVVIAWATASPPGSSPDEDFHLASIWCPTPLDGSCDTRIAEGELQPGESRTQVLVPQVVLASAICTAFHPENSGACVDDLTNNLYWTGRVDNGLYPGGFYDVMHWFVGPDVQASVTTMRIANGVLAIALFTATALLLPRPSRRLVTYGYLAVSVPMATYLIASINPSGWAFTGVAVAWAGMHGFVTQPHRRRRYALAGLALVGALIGALARADAGAYLGVAAAGIVALHFRSVKEKLWIVALPAAVTFIGLIGFLSASQTDALGGMAGTTGPGDGDLLFSNVLALPQLLIGAQAEALNWVDTPVPAIVWVPGVLLAGALALFGMRSVELPKGLALFGLVSVYVVLPVLLLQRSGMWVGVEVQARYIAPLVPVIMATALWNPSSRGTFRLTVPQTILAYLTLVVGNSVMLHVQIRRFVTGLDVHGLNLSRYVEWWASPISPMFTWLLGSLGFAMLAAALFLVRRPDTAGSAQPEIERPAFAEA